MNTSHPAAGGFFRMPTQWLRADMSLGAKVLLAHFCAVAAADGSSYYSYEQLGEILGRTKGSISGYVKELRELGFIHTNEQKRKNGFNYRLKIFVTGWAEMVRLWSEQRAAKTARIHAAAQKDADQSSRPMKKRVKSKHHIVQKIERDVQSTERNDPTGHKTQIQKTYTTPTPVDRMVTAMLRDNPQQRVWSFSQEQEWKNFRADDNASFTTHGTLPQPELITRLQASIQGMSEKLGILERHEREAYVAAKTDEFVASRKISSTIEEREAFRSVICENCCTAPQIHAAFEKLNQNWHPSWRRISKPEQIKEICLSEEVTRHQPSREDIVFLTRQKSRMKQFLYTYRNLNGTPYPDQGCDT